MAVLSAKELCALREQLQYDAERAKKEPQDDLRTDWLDPVRWSKYMGETGRALYETFADEELLDILRREAEVLGHVPAQKEVFCVYRYYIRRRYGNWVKALRAAGLREPKGKKS